MRSPALSTLFLTLFFLLFSVICAAPIASPNVSSERGCLDPCSDAVTPQPENRALVKKCYYDTGTGYPHCNTPPVSSESPAPTSSSPTASTTDVPQSSPSPIKWFTEIAILPSDFTGSKA